MSAASSAARFRFPDPSTPTPPPRRHYTHRGKIPRANSPKEDCVAVYYRVKFPQTEGTKCVPRHTPAEELVEIPEVKELTNNSGGNIFVSPAKSATSETEIRIETSITDLMERMKTEIKTELEEKYLTEMEARNKYSTKTDSEYVLFVAKYSSIRNIEDWCLARMRRLAGLHGNPTHKHTVETFQKYFIVSQFPTEYLDSLKNSAERDTAISILHVPSTDKNAVEVMWRALQPQLSEDDCRKYGMLLKFGVGNTQVMRK
jgi:hypothetical protein